MRRMAIAALLVLISLSPARAVAAPIITFDWSSSELQFGLTSSSQHGEDGIQVTLPDGSTIGDPPNIHSTFLANTGPLLELTLHLDSGGNVLSSEYIYTGGTFEFHVTIDAPFDPVLDGVSGTFTAPILWARHRVQDEADDFSSPVDSFYRLGAGQFDPALAAAFGMPERTKSGEMISGEFGIYNHILFFLRDGGDHTSPERFAHDGGLIARIQAPEPSLGLLTILGIAVARVRFRR